jgi:hypothetical protein
LLQASPTVQALPSEHDAPLGFAGFEQTPDAGLQAPAVWHESIAVQVTGFSPTHTPPEQLSSWVQAFPSSQALVLAANTHPAAGLQVSVVQTLLSLQTTAGPG